MNPDSSTSSSTASSSSATIIADIVRLLAPGDREAFDEALQQAIRGRELPDDEMRRVAERTWGQWCKYGWPRK